MSNLNPPSTTFTLTTQTQTFCDAICQPTLRQQLYTQLPITCKPQAYKLLADSNKHLVRTTQLYYEAPFIQTSTISQMFYAVLHCSANKAKGMMEAAKKITPDCYFYTSEAIEDESCEQYNDVVT